MLFSEDSWPTHLRGKERAFRTVADALSDFKGRTGALHREDLNEEVDQFASVVAACIQMVQESKSHPIEYSDPLKVLPKLEVLSSFIGSDSSGAVAGSKLAPNLQKVKATAWCLCCLCGSTSAPPMGPSPTMTERPKHLRCGANLFGVRYPPVPVGPQTCLRARRGVLISALWCRATNILACPARGASIFNGVALHIQPPCAHGVCGVKKLRFFFAPPASLLVARGAPTFYGAISRHRLLRAYFAQGVRF